MYDEGGSFGHNDIDRTRYKARLLNNLYGKSETEIKKNAIVRILRLAFPSKRFLVQKGFMKETSGVLMIPVGWIKRWLDVIFKGKIISFLLI